ncbi:MAG TPA: hypothetical protein VGR45_15130 [Stellaceae bacterium]|nr:hypothetical protein [Stellaceae bacterium]
MGEAKRKALSITGGKPAGFEDITHMHRIGERIAAPPPRYLKPTHQVFVMVKDEQNPRGVLTAISPRAPFEFCIPLLDAAKRAIAIGARRNWGEPQIMRTFDLTAA